MALNPFLQHHRGCRRSDGLRKSSAQDLWQRMCSEQSAEDWAQKQGCVSIFLERVRNCWFLCTWLYSQQKNTTHRYTLRPQSEWEASPAPSVTLCLPAFNCFCGKKGSGLCPSSQGPGKDISVTATPVLPVSLSLQNHLSRFQHSQKIHWQKQSLIDRAWTKYFLKEISLITVLTF